MCNLKKDNDEISFRLKKYAMGETYTFTLSGVSRRSEKKFRSLKGKIWIPVFKGSVPVRDVDYDAVDRELSFEFDTAVQWQTPTVTITAGGQTYSERIIDLDSRDLEVKVKNLKKGKKYKYRITGIHRRGDTQYTTISGSFKA